jgi:WD40 repeat protein
VRFFSIRFRKGNFAMSYVAFISYKHSLSSRPQAECLETVLKQYSKPWWKPPIAIFRDERVLRPGDDLPAGIRKALEESDYLVYLASKEAAASDWVRDELRIWCEDLKRSQRLLIAHIADRITTNPSTRDIIWEETDALPAMLHPYITSIPLWSELSWANTPEQRDLNNVDYKKQINAMIAKFRGKTPGEMNDEQVLTYRRNILLRNIGIGVVVACAIIATLFGIEALFDRNAARESQRMAVLSQHAAEDSAFEANQQKIAAQKANGIAQDQRRLTDQRASIALSRQLAAQAISMRTDQLDTALLIGAAAQQTAPTPEARDALLTVLTERPHFDRYLRREGRLTRLAFDQAGTLVLDEGKRRVALLDSWTLSDKETQVGGTTAARGVTVSPDGHWVAALDDEDNSLQLWSVDRPRKPRSIKVGFGGFVGLDMAHGSAGYASGPCPIAFAGNNHGILYVAPSMRLVFHANGSNDAAVEFQTGSDMSDDNRIGAVGSSVSGTIVGAISKSTVFIWELDHPQIPIKVLNAPDSKRLNDFVFLRSGGVAALGDDGEVFVWEKLDDKSPRQFHAHAVSGQHIAVSADGKWLATAGAEKGSSITEEAATAKLWKIGPYGIGATRAGTFALSGNHTFSLSFSGDSRILATTSENGFAEFWDIEQPEPIATRFLRPDGTPVVASTLTTYRDRPGLVVADSSEGILEVNKDSVARVVLPMDPRTSSSINGAALITDR